jgi:hypothetical protein
MALPNTPVTLTVEQIDQLNRRLSNMRHDINNHLSLIVAAAELIRFNPEMIHKMAGTLVDQPPKISEEMAKFSDEFKKVLEISP